MDYSTGLAIGMASCSSRGTLEPIDLLWAVLIGIALFVVVITVLNRITR